MRQIAVAIVTAVTVLMMFAVIVPERRTIVLLAPINDYKTTPSELVQALSDGWNITSAFDGRVYILERSRLRLP